jgi:hypothetical protein
MTPVDSVKVRTHSPKTATWLALVPGAGQIYNKKYWKLPIVYGGLGATSYLIYYYQKETSIYQKEYRARRKEETENLNPELAHLSDDKVFDNRNINRRNMEICVAASAVVYALSIIDACVDAHLYYYDVSDNLAMAVRPKLIYNPVSGVPTPSLALILKF